MTSPPNDSERRKELLHKLFGFKEFRPGQEEIVEAVSDGQNVLAIMPTGGGKSLCFQLPALLRDGLCVVISPLIALMRDQVSALKDAGIPAASLTSGNTAEENDEILRALEDQRLKVLYIAPERLASTGTLRLLKRSNCTLIAVDEAHCVSQWGHDFRPDYLRIGLLRKELNVPLAAFTATADAATRSEMIERLFDGTEPQTYLRGFDRPNIRIAFSVKNSPREQILAFARARKDQAGIVYCATRARTESLADALNRAGLKALAYHGGMEDWQRRDVEAQFKTEDGLIICATVAFGMGVDKPDVRWVAHADLPKSIEAYYQEIGRAGRDGLPADTLTLFGADDIRLRRAQIDESLAPPDRLNADHARLNTLLGLAEASGCRRRMLLAYFGEISDDCGNCDICENPVQTFDATEPIRMAMSAILRTGESFGYTHLIDILLGNVTERVKDRGHDQLPTFGVGRALSRTRWQGIFRQMMGRDLIRPNRERHGALCLTEAARPVLRGEQSVHLRADTLESQKFRRAPKALVSDEDAPLLAALKSYRRKLAEEAKIPPYIIFNDRSLIEMAERRPETLDDFARIGGVGTTKLARYADGFLAVITGDDPDHTHPVRRKLAGRDSGACFDDLTDAEQRLSRGECGTLKLISLTAGQRAKLATQRPQDLQAIERLIGPKATERFGQAFLDVLRNQQD